MITAERPTKTAIALPEPPLDLGDLVWELRLLWQKLGWIAWQRVDGKTITQVRNPKLILGLRASAILSMAHLLADMGQAEREQAHEQACRVVDSKLLQTATDSEMLTYYSSFLSEQALLQLRRRFEAEIIK